jgi:hypothetical protein
VASTGPPAYAWDWFARQRLPWRRARERLATSTSPVAGRYGAVADRSDVLPLLRADYPRDDVVRHVVREVVVELVFLGDVSRPFADLGVSSPPRGMRWWWTSLTGEELDTPEPGEPASGAVQTRLELDLGLDPDEPAPPPPRRRDPTAQLTLDEVLEGYGD